MTAYFGDDSPENTDAGCDGGMCGKGNYHPSEFFREKRRPDASPLTEVDIFHLLIGQAENAMNTLHVEEGLRHYQQAYDLALEVEELGLDYCFGVMFNLHYFHLHDHAYNMAMEIALKAIEKKDIELLRDIWRLCPEMGVPGGELQEAALTLRDGIESMFPQVMAYPAESKSF